MSSHTTSTPALARTDLRFCQLIAWLPSWSMADWLSFKQVRLEAQAWLGPQASQVGLRVHCHLSLYPPTYNTSCGLVSDVTRPTHVLLAITLQLIISLERRFTGNNG